MKFEAKYTPTWAVMVAQTRNRQSGAIYSVYDNEVAGFETAPDERWALVCECHNQIVNFRKKIAALSHMRSADWCSECQKIAYGELPKLSLSEAKRLANTEKVIETEW